MKEKLRQMKGITLIALVITIIVLLILAGVSIAMLTGGNGILTQAQRTKKETEQSNVKEKVQLAMQSILTENEINGKEITPEDLKNQILVENPDLSVEEPETAIFPTIIEVEGIPIGIDKDYNVEIATSTGVIENANSVEENAKEIYGKYVLNYDSDGVTGVAWRILHSDGENIYLIADDFIEYDKIPYSTIQGIKTENKPNQGQRPCCAFFSNILSDYNGSSDITSSNPAYKWLSQYYNSGYQSDSSGMKAVAYMMDTYAWEEFKMSSALYTIGGPTLEMWLDSYNKKYGTKYEYQVTSSSGYKIRESENDEFTGTIINLLNTSDDLYVEKSDDVWAMWVATPFGADRGAIFISDRRW